MIIHLSDHIYRKTVKEMIKDIDLIDNSFSYTYSKYKDEVGLIPTIIKCCFDKFPNILSKTEQYLVYWFKRKITFYTDNKVGSSEFELTPDMINHIK